jgi:hypothetical protein
LPGWAPFLEAGLWQSAIADLLSAGFRVSLDKVIACPLRAIGEASAPATGANATATAANPAIKRREARIDDPFGLILPTIGGRRQAFPAAAVIPTKS